MPNGGGTGYFDHSDQQDHHHQEIESLKAENARLRANQIAARVWCDEQMEKYKMDADACQAIAKILTEVMVRQES
ncbi:hypothetical protein LCGC14_0298130 [marine sediment metagenome]|uniref:Uncharacterized protein n=1 Tax=marine sediment metagenome TaxID=412755 RepID=A0A0F9TW66_9ZZZZ